MKLGKMQEVDIRKVWAHEQYDFSKWLSAEENINELGNILNLSLTDVKTEQFVGGYRCDIICKDEITGKSRIIILKTSEGDLVGIIVDQVNQVLTLDSNNVEKVRYDDKKGKADASFVNGVGHYDGGLVSILDLDAVVSEKDVKEKAANAG